MKWYEGNIAEAVSYSKEKNAIFVVFVEGKDELSQKLLRFINEEKIRSKLESNDFVAIKIESDSQTYMQFATIYQMVPVPSIFFIGKSGAPLEVATGIIESADELERKINNVMTLTSKSVSPATSASSAFIASEKTATVKDVAAPPPDGPSTSLAAKKLTQEPTDEIVCDGDVCYKKPKEVVKTPDEPAAVDGGSVAAEKADLSQNIEEKKEEQDDTESILETRKSFEERRRQRIELENELEKRRELKRRQESRDVQHMQQWQKEQELKELKENMRRERLEEQAARERIRAQIAADRAERAVKFASEAETSVSGASASNAVNIPNSTVAPSPPRDNIGEELTRLQFRLSTGNTKTQSFNSQDTLGSVRTYVKKELLPGTGIREFVLATTYPKREFNAENDKETLIELGLFPTAVILVIGKSSSNPVGIITRSGGIFNILSSLFWTMLSPVFSVLGYLKSFGRRGGNDADNAANVGAQKRASEEQGVQHDAAKRRNLDRFLTGPSTSKESSNNANRFNDNNDQKPYQRYGGSNIHRLSDNRKDSDDENATWNGNSTQQQ